MPKFATQTKPSKRFAQSPQNTGRGKRTTAIDTTANQSGRKVRGTAINVPINKK